MNQDFRDLLAAFNDHHVDFIVVGAHALAAHGHVRATKDLDVWIRPAKDNALRAIQALKAFGAPLQELTVDDLSIPGIIFQIGVPPLRIDVLTAVDGLTFEEAWANRMHTVFADQPAAVLSRSDIILNKRTSARKQDLADIEALEKLG
ncbi:MAG TPA: hypothetical protein PLU72_20250 [Candidatus Ozemobacteraceae bacterium]|nr:hypothetical protein [Candidatus Ozemobacteraceae bacterium]